MKHKGSGARKLPKNSSHSVGQKSKNPRLEKQEIERLQTLISQKIKDKSAAKKAALIIEELLKGLK